MLWFKPYTVDDLEGFRNANMGTHVGIHFEEVGDDYIKASMPVDHRTVQPFGILHGGASCVLSETLGSVAAWMCVDPDKQMIVGIEINANHIRSVREGHVIGTCKPFQTGRKLHVWQTEIHEEATGKLVCVSRLSVMILDKPAQKSA